MKLLGDFFVKIIAVTVLISSPFGFAQDSAKVPQSAGAAYEAKSKKLNRAQIDKLLEKPGEIIFIDLRRPDELTRIGGFPVYLSIQLADLEKSLAFIPKERRVITVSNHAGRALRGADVLAAKGFNVAGAAGVQDYEAEGGSLLKVAPPVPKS
jgi:rhodanese-related sulfurtransferase